MIKSVGDRLTLQFIEAGKSKFSGLDPMIAKQRLEIINTIKSTEDLPPFKSFGLHMLKGTRSGFYSITINGPWRLIFRFENGNAYDVQIINYH